MSNWHIGSSVAYDAAATGPTAASLDRVTTPVTPHTKGVYETLGTDTLFDYHGVIITGTSTHVDRFFVDFAIGPAGAEEVIIENFYVDCGAGSRTNQPTLFLPIRIPGGSRIAARAQSSLGSNEPRVGLIGVSTGWNSGLRMGEKVVSLGADLANTKGTTLLANPVEGNAKGVYAEVASVVPVDVTALGICISGNQVYTRNSFYYRIDLAVGASGSETVILPDLPACSDSAGDMPRPNAVGAWPIRLPVGERLAGRMSANTTSDTGRDLDIVCYGVVG